jgi:hypothetical protein
VIANDHEYSSKKAGSSSFREPCYVSLLDLGAQSRFTRKEKFLTARMGFYIPDRRYLKPEMLFAPERSEVVDGIEIRGHSEFLLRTKESLELLKPTPQFDIIRAHIEMIQPGRRSGMKAWARKPIFVVGKRTWQHSAQWYAGAIAHDAYHSKLYHEAKQALGDKEPAADTWTGVEAEKHCLAFQRQVLLRLGADPSTIAYLEECEKHPAYQGRNRGWRSWLDYIRRWW